VHFYELEIYDKPLGIPYLRIDDPKSHGYVNLRSNPGEIELLPELIDAPKLREFLLAINAPHSKFQTFGCEKWVSPWSNECLPGFTSRYGSYVDISFADIRHALQQASYDAIISGYRGYGNTKIPHGGVQTGFALRPTMSANGSIKAWWTLEFWNFGIGRSEIEAQTWWSRGIDCFWEFLKLK
jgi:hypothetical protein